AGSVNRFTADRREKVSVGAVVTWNPETGPVGSLLPGARVRRAAARWALGLAGFPLSPDDDEAPPGTFVGSKTPCGRLLDRFVADPKLHSVGISGPDGRILGIVDRQRLFALVDLAGEEVFGAWPADRQAPK